VLDRGSCSIPRQLAPIGSRLRLPTMVEDRHPDMLLGPHARYVDRLARRPEEERGKWDEFARRIKPPLGVFSLTARRNDVGCGFEKKRGNTGGLSRPPERAGPACRPACIIHVVVRRAAAGRRQCRIWPTRPATSGSGPKTLVLLESIDVPQRPVGARRMAPLSRPTLWGTPPRRARVVEGCRAGRCQHGSIRGASTRRRAMPITVSGRG